MQNNLKEQEMKIHQEDITNSRLLRKHLFQSLQEFFDAKVARKVTDDFRADLMLEIKGIEAYGKQVMTDFHIGNLVHKTGRLLEVK